MTPYERVKLSRERTAGTFPLPSVLDCIRYSLCELCEYDDALLRIERTGDKRNNDKAHDPRNELGQCGYMLLSGAMQAGCAPTFAARYEREGIEPLTYHIALLSDMSSLMLNVWCNYDLLAQYDFECSYASFWRLCDVHGWSIDALIDDTCAAFEAKYAPREVR